MTLDWQLVVVTACILWGVAVLLKRSYLLFFRPSTSGCGSGHCHGCPSNSGKQSGELVQLEFGAPSPNKSPRAH